MMKLAMLVVTLAFTGGCARVEGAAGSGSLTIFAASSLTEVFPELDPDVEYQFAGSDDLALQLREGARADLLAT
ncbi:MAG: molybdate-binding protein, partial [Actinobacteria bacterium]|nr:molybdate-binding protein [Actinomycetota bacterium]